MPLTRRLQDQMTGMQHHPGRLQGFIPGRITILAVSNDWIPLMRTMNANLVRSSRNGLRPHPTNTLRMRDDRKLRFAVFTLH